MRYVLRTAAMAGAALVVTAVGARAQALAGPGVTVAAGLMNFDLSGTGNTLVVAVRGDLPITPVFGVEAAVQGAMPDQQFGGDPLLLIPEVQLQAQLPLSGFAPYLGVGVGVVYQASSDDISSRTNLAISGGLGARMGLGSRLAAVVDGRVHAIGSEFAGTTAELTIGLRWRVGGAP